jgi:hypothetical protein
VTRWVCPRCEPGFRALALFLPRPVDDARIARTIRASDRIVHFVTLTAVDDVDGRVRGWLSEAYLAPADYFFSMPCGSSTYLRAAPWSNSW